MTTGTVLDIQRFSTHDGPGIRTVVFLKGCPLHCPWCHNPEGRSPHPQLLYSPALCVGCGRCTEVCLQHAHRIDHGMHTLDRNRCLACLRCAEACPSQALKTAGIRMSVPQVLEEIEKDRVFYEESSGGMTVSGGEPMAQFEFAHDLLAAARDSSLHTCMETCGAGPQENWRQIAPLVDLFLWDIKHTDEHAHAALTGITLDEVLDNLRLVDAIGGRTRLRCTLLAGVTLHRNHLDAVAGIAAGLRHCQGVDLLSAHRLGEAKFAALGMIPAPHADWTVGPEEIAEARAYLHRKHAL